MRVRHVHLVIEHRPHGGVAAVGDQHRPPRGKRAGRRAQRAPNSSVPAMSRELPVELGALVCDGLAVLRDLAAARVEVHASGSRGELVGQRGEEQLRVARAPQFPQACSRRARGRRYRPGSSSARTGAASTAALPHQSVSPRREPTHQHQVGSRCALRGCSFTWASASRASQVSGSTPRAAQLVVTGACSSSATVSARRRRRHELLRCRRGSSAVPPPPAGRPRARPGPGRLDRLGAPVLVRLPGRDVGLHLAVHDVLGHVEVHNAGASIEAVPQRRAPEFGHPVERQQLRCSTLTGA